MGNAVKCIAAVGGFNVGILAILIGLVSTKLPNVALFIGVGLLLVVLSGAGAIHLIARDIDFVVVWKRTLVFLLGLGVIVVTLWAGQAHRPF